VVGVTESFQTRGGSGPFPTEITGDLAQQLRGTGEQPWDEFGTTTGRPRRVGWLDLVLLRYAVRVNGISELALTKLDILSGFDQVFMCSNYRKNGMQYSELPYGPGELKGYEPVYEELPGWHEDITAIRECEDLPVSARAYITKIEDLIGIKSSMVSVGPERNQFIQNT